MPSGPSLLLVACSSGGHLTAVSVLDNVVQVAVAVDLVVLCGAVADDVARAGAQALGLVVAVAVTQLDLVGASRDGELDIARRAGKRAQRARVGARVLAVLPDHPGVLLRRRLDLLPEADRGDSPPSEEVLLSRRRGEGGAGGEEGDDGKGLLHFGWWCCRMFRNVECVFCC